MNELPIKTKNDYILESNIELLIKPTKDKEIDEIFAEIYILLKNEFKYEKMPIFNIPDEIKKIDKNFKYKPYYRFYNNEISIFIGIDMIAFNVKKPYLGWEKYKEYIISNLNKFKSIYLFEDIEQLSIKYIDFFENMKIFDKLILNISFNNDYLKNKSMLEKIFKVNLNCDNSIVDLKIVEDIELKQLNKFGSIIDITSKYNKILKFEGIEKALEEIHYDGKKIFFELLEKKFLETLEPIYV